MSTDEPKPAAPPPLEPIAAPTFDEADLATESLDTAAGGIELPSRYEVRESLGPEGDADLFLVHDHELGRDVVLKLLRADAPDHVAMAFRDEARTVARIDHPGAVAVHDLAALGSGRLYVTRAPLDGRPLGSWARQVELRRVLRWLVFATDTLVAAHAVGVQHRRLEPGSVIVGRVVKVRGFGAGAADPSPFMAPELVRGEAADARADVFSLGRVAQHVLADPLPDELAAVLRRASAPAPADRYPSAQGLLAALEDWLDQG